MAHESTPALSLLSGVQWGDVLYAFAMGALVSVLMTLREHNGSPEAGRPRLQFSRLLVDTLIAGILGTGGALFLIGMFPKLATFAGLTLLSGAIGAIGPKGADWFRNNGLKVGLAWVGSQAGAFSKAVAAQGGGDDDEKQDAEKPNAAGKAP